jgi:hypothetical protein
MLESNWLLALAWAGFAIVVAVDVVVVVVVVIVAVVNVKSLFDDEGRREEDPRMLFDFAVIFSGSKPFASSLMASTTGFWRVSETCQKATKQQQYNKQNKKYSFPYNFSILKISKYVNRITFRFLPRE